MCIKNYDEYYKENWINKFLKFCKLDGYRIVYFYVDGKPIEKEFDFAIRNTFYQDAIEYIKRQKSKLAAFKKKISDHHASSQKQLEEIMKKSPDGKETAKIEPKIEKLSAEIEGLRKISMEQMKTNQSVDNKIEDLSKCMNDMSNVMNEILKEVKNTKRQSQDEMIKEIMPQKPTNLEIKQPILQDKKPQNNE